MYLKLYTKYLFFVIHSSSEGPSESIHHWVQFRSIRLRQSFGWLQQQRRKHPQIQEGWHRGCCAKEGCLYWEGKFGFTFWLYCLYLLSEIANTFILHKLRLNLLMNKNFQYFKLEVFYWVTFAIISTCVHKRSRFYR